MDQIPLHLTAGPLSGWPVEHLRRVYRLVAGDVHRKVLEGAPENEIAASEAQAAMFADELVRRGEL